MIPRHEQPYNTIGASRAPDAIYLNSMDELNPRCSGLADPVRRFGQIDAGVGTGENRGRATLADR
ncbi:MAG: hypothetical protein WD049_00320 [Candidatus Paceibacterota bacterium]